MNESPAGTRRDFLARLPFLAAGGAMVLVTLGALVRSGGGQASTCTQAPGCRSCAAFRGCGLPQARAVRRRPANEAGPTPSADPAASQTEVGDG